MKTLFLLLTLLSTLFAQDPNSCTQEDFEISKETSAVPQEACQFALHIQKLVLDKDLQGFMALAQGELSHGPRQSFIKGKSFDAIFPKQWRQRILAAKLEREPIGWRGYMIANGLVWYHKHEGMWKIFALNGANTEMANTNLPKQWVIQGKTIAPQCFERQWMSNDNYEEYEEKFHITDTKDFERNPGNYFGKAIPNFKPIIPSWSSDGTTLSLVTDVTQCLKQNYTITLGKESVDSKECDSDGNCVEYSYQILAKLSSKQCQALAPHLKNPCKDAYLLGVGDYSGGSMGWDTSFVIYGNFLLNDHHLIVPLKNFSSKNEAKNFTDSLN